MGSVAGDRASPGLFKPAEAARAKPLSAEKMSPWGYSELPLLDIVVVIILLLLLLL